jgi:hypothetical protein
MTHLWAFLKRRIAELIRTLDPPRGQHRGPGPEPHQQAPDDDITHRSTP